MPRWSSTSLLYCHVFRWISRLTPSATRCAWPRAGAPSSRSRTRASPGAYWRISSSSRLAKKTDPPGSPWRPARPRSWWSSLLLACRPVPMTYRPPSSAIRSRSPLVPPRRMSVPRPAIWVDTVIAPRAPASATMAASWASFLALSTVHGSPARPSSPASRSDSAMSSVPIRTGRPVACAVGHLADDRFLLVLDGRVQPVGLVDADARAVRRDHRDLQAVELPELLAGRHRGPGHPADGPVAADQGLDGDGVENLAALARGQALLGLDRRVQAVGPALPPGHPAPGLVDQVHRAVPHDVVHVALEQRMRVQGHVEPGQRLGVLGGVQVDAAERLFRGARSRAGQGHVAAVFVDLVVLGRGQARPRSAPSRGRCPRSPPRPRGPAAPAPRRSAPSRPRRSGPRPGRPRPGRRRR